MQQPLSYFSPNQFDDSLTKGTLSVPGRRSTSRQMSATDTSLNLIRSPSSQSFENTSEADDTFDEQPGGLSMRRGTSPLDGLSRVDTASAYTVGGQASFQLVGKMNATMRRLELELENCKQDLSKMTRAKDDAFQEVVKLMKENEELKEAGTKVGDLERQIRDLGMREQTTLEMLGEKSEQVEELRADVQDLKSMYRQQIEELVDRLNSK
jgi:TATA element modulatory factor